MKTKISDIIEPSVFAPYVIERTAELSRLVQSGIIGMDAQLDNLASGAGSIINMPFWDDLDGESEELSDSNSLTPDKITADQDKAIKHFRGKSWATNDLAKYLSGDDPMAAIGDLVAAWWARDMQKTVLLPTLAGMFGSALSSTHVLDLAIENGNAATEANLIGSDAVIDAAGLLGDHWDRIVAMTMHSKPFQRLQKLGLIETEQLQDQNITINRFLGREVIVDDGMPKVAGSTSGFKYTTYLYAKGAIGQGNGGPDTDEAVETDRDKLAGDNLLINRRHFILHPRGVAFTGSIAGVTPTKTELSTAENWTKKYEDKNIRVLKLVTNG